MESDDADDAGENSCCPICSEILLSSDQECPVICATQACKFNMCYDCTSKLIRTSNHGPQEASDGNLFSIGLQCPSCRGSFVTKLNDVLLVRDGEVQDRLQEMPDSELNAADLRKKYDVSDDKMTLLNEARQRYTGNKKGVPSCEEKETKSKDEGVVDMSNKISFVDNMLFSGLEHCMSEAERAYVVQLMTSGCPLKLVQGVQILASIIQMNTHAKRIQSSQEEGEPGVKQGNNPVAVYANVQDSRRTVGSPNNNANVQRKTKQNPQQSKPRPSLSSSAIPRSRIDSQSQFQRECAQRQKWGSMYPLPFRMPRAVTLPLDFDVYSKKNLTFIDDESIFPFLKYDKRYSRISYENRCKICQDAFSTLSISTWGKLIKRTSEFPGATNILLGLEHDVEDRQLPDIKVPWRRVVVSSVDRNMARIVGLRVGDVITHLDGEPMDGNVEKLKFLLSAKKNESTMGGRAPSVQIVVNAEVSVAEALRLRSFVARNQTD